MAVFTAIAIASLAIEAYGAIKASHAQKKAGEAAQSAANDQATLSDYNANVAELQSQDAIARGTEEENKFRAQVRETVGQQRAGFAGGNIDVNAGSAVDVQADAAYLGELDSLQIRTNAAREAWGYKVQAEDYRRQADITRKTGVNLAAAGQAAGNATLIGAGSSLLGGSASLLKAKYGGKK